MHRWFRRILPTFLLLLTVAVPPAALASHPVAEDQATDPVPAPEAVAAACVLVPGPPNTFAYIWTPPEELQSVAWKLPIGACTACAASGGVLNVTNARIRMRWLRACSAQAEISIVGAAPGPNCLVPDPTQVLCGPATYTISGVTNGSVNHTLPLPTGCCVAGDAFVLVRFTGLGACASGGVSPGLAAANTTCASCTQFVTATVIHPTSTEWCASGVANPMWFSVDTECCAATPSLGHSWGGIKTLYR